MDGHIEPIVFTTGEKFYTDHLMEIIDPKREVFSHALYQNACYTLEIPDEDVYQYVKDISRFQNRNLRRSILMDPQLTNFMLTPDNGFPVLPYTAQYDAKDNYLSMLKEELEYMKELPDVRQYLQDTFRIRKTLKNAKLI